MRRKKGRRFKAAEIPPSKIIFFGGDSLRPSIRGHKAVPRKAVVKRLAARGKLKTVNTPEASRAGARQRRYKNESALCSFLKVFGDCDALDGINILVCGLHALWGTPRPEPFRSATL